MSEVEALPRGRSVYTAKRTVANPDRHWSMQTVTWSFVQKQAFQRDFCGTPHFHEILLGDQPPGYLCAKSWLRLHHEKFGPRDWIILRTVDPEEGEDVNFFSGIYTHSESEEPQCWNATDMFRLFLKRGDDGELTPAGDTEIWDHMMAEDYHLYENVADLQSLLDCIAQCPEPYWRDVGFHLIASHWRVSTMCILLSYFCERFFSRKARCAQLLIHTTNEWRLKLASDGTIEEFKFLHSGGKKTVTTTLYESANSYTEEQWQTLLQQLYLKHWCTSAFVSAPGFAKLTVTSPFNASVEQRNQQLLTLAAEHGCRVSSKISFKKIPALLRFKPIHDRYIGYVMALAPFDHPALVVNSILTWSVPEFLVVPNYVATRIIESIRKFVRGREQQLAEMPYGRRAKKKAMLKFKEIEGV